MTNLRFDPARSSFKIETRAKGMLAKLAHDLSIAAGEVSASVRLENARAFVEVRVVVARLEVEGTLKGGQVDRSGISASDRREIEKKIRAEVLPAPEVVVAMEADLGSGGLQGAADRSVEAHGRVELGRKSARVSSRVVLAVAADAVAATGRVRINLPSLGIAPPKGPLGAFRVDDDVDVAFTAVFTIAVAD